VLAIVSWQASVVRAEPTPAEKETARGLMSDGRSLRDQGDLRAALRYFQAADAIMHVPTTALEVAKTLIALGSYLEARDTLRRVVLSPVKPDEPAPFREARVAAEGLDAQLDALIGAVKIEVTGAAPGATVTTAAPAGAAPAPIAARSEASSRGVPTLAYVGFVGGGAALVLGSVTGALSMASKSSAEEGCVDHRCPPDVWGKLDTAQSLATISNVSFVVAGLGAGLGVGALLLSHGERSGANGHDAAVRIVPTLGGVAAAGRF